MLRRIDLEDKEWKKLKSIARKKGQYISVFVGDIIRKFFKEVK